MTCPLCRHEFDPSEMPCNSGCPMARICKVLCCPRCGYEFVEESAVVNLVKRIATLLRSGRAAAR